MPDSVGIGCIQVGARALAHSPHFLICIFSVFHLRGEVNGGELGSIVEVPLTLGPGSRSFFIGRVGHAYVESACVRSDSDNVREGSDGQLPPLSSQDLVALRPAAGILMSHAGKNSLP